MEAETEANDNRSLFFMTGIKIEKKGTGSLHIGDEEEVDARSRWTEKDSRKEVCNRNRRECTYIYIPRMLRDRRVGGVE